MVKPKVLVLDIETSPLIAFAWNRRDVNIALNQIKDDWYVIAWAAKWLGSSKVWYQDNRNVWQTKSDKELLQMLWQLINDADIVITQNGKKFDLPKLNARFILNGFPPPKPVKHLDTYLIARSVFGFTSNKLEYLTDKLCTKYKKLSHSKFSGMELWKACLSGNQEAWKEMEKYNKHDVLATEELYNKLQEWVPQRMPSVVHDCPRRYHKVNVYRFHDGKRRAYCQCLKCGAWFWGE